MTQYQVRVRLSLPPDVYARLVAMPPAVRSQAISAVLTAVLDGIDLPRVAVATGELKRLGNLLNQALHYYYTAGHFDSRRVTNAIDFIDRLRGPYKRR